MKSLTLLTALSLLLTSCGAIGGWAGERVNGVGEPQTESRDVGSFSQVSLSGVGEVHLHQGPYKPIEITAEQNILDIMETEVRGDRLHIGTKKGYYIGRTKKLEIHVWSQEYTSAHSSGAGDIRTADRISGDDFDISLSGAGSFSGDLEVKELRTDISGAGNATLSGSAQKHEFYISGAGSVSAYDLRTESSLANISGAGDAKLHCESELEARVSGAGSIRYRGNPSVEKHVSGAATIKADR
jgi:hypothetical protein